MQLPMPHHVLDWGQRPEQNSTTLNASPDAPPCAGLGASSRTKCLAMRWYSISIGNWTKASLNAKTKAQYCKGVHNQFQSRTKGASPDYQGSGKELNSPVHTKQPRASQHHKYSPLAVRKNKLRYARRVGILSTEQTCTLRSLKHGILLPISYNGHALAKSKIESFASADRTN